MGANTQNLSSLRGDWRGIGLGIGGDWWGLVGIGERSACRAPATTLQNVVLPTRPQASEADEAAAFIILTKGKRSATGDCGIGPGQQRGIAASGRDSTASRILPSACVCLFSYDDVRSARRPSRQPSRGGAAGAGQAVWGSRACAGAYRWGQPNPFGCQQLQGATRHNMDVES